jgi:hypothetical protein
MACDICGKTGVSLENLNDQYQTSDIKSICSECSLIVNDKLWKIRKLSMNIVERSLISFMVNRKNLAIKNRN